MLKTLRIALMWWLAFALPVQGFAATTMLFCMGGSHGQMAAVASTMPHEHEGTHSHGDAHSHGHHHAAAHDHAVHEASAKAQDASHAHDAHPTHKTAGQCSACSACCMSVAMPSAVITFDPLKVSSGLVASEHPSHPDFLTDGPERPPRAIFA